MPKAENALIPVRWYAANKKASARLEALGIPKAKTYEAHNGETWEKITMRRGECLGTVEGLRAFGTGKREINKAVDHFHGQGATILDIETGQDSRAHGPRMFDVATRPRRLTEEDKKLLAETRADASRKKRGMASKAQAYIIWHKIGPSVQVKCEATGWSRAALYNEFGKTGAPTGRRPKNFVAKERELPPVKVKPARPKGGFVYFMQIGGKGPVKIGYANSIKDRFSSHRGSNSADPVLLAAMRGTMKSEHQLHERFSALRLDKKREWFRLRGDLKTFIGALPKIETDLE